MSDTQIVVNLSLDGIGADHDKIRGIPGNFERTMKTFHALRAIDAPNFTLGVHTVISRFNVDRIGPLADYVRTLGPDSYIAEIAEERVELGTIDAGITPGVEDFRKAADVLIDYMDKESLAGMGRLAQAFGAVTTGWLKEAQGAPANGPVLRRVCPAQVVQRDVWACCIRGESIGNLRDYDYNFHRLVQPRGRRIRKSIAAGECACPLAMPHIPICSAMFQP